MVLALKSTLALHTRCENQIANEINREPIRFGDTVLVRDFERQYRYGTHRPVSPSRKYNCHGLSFASRRTWIQETSAIKKIIEDDEYQIVPVGRVMAGDIAVYYDATGDAEHSGIVVRMNELNVPIILSKWGFCHEVVHHVAQCPYDAGNVVYYRITT